MNQAPSIPTLDDVHAARERIAPYLSPTPLYRYDDLTELVGTEIWVKHENLWGAQTQSSSWNRRVCGGNRVCAPTGRSRQLPHG
jgi:hypothetical protein